MATYVNIPQEKKYLYCVYCIVIKLIVTRQFYDLKGSDFSEWQVKHETYINRFRRRYRYKMYSVRDMTVI